METRWGPLAIHTLHIEHVMLLLLYTMITVVNSWMYKGMKGIHWFSLYNLFALLGALSVALRGSIPDFVSIVVGNLFVVAGYFVLFLSLAALFGGKRYILWMQSLLVFAGAVTMLQWGLFHPDTRLRLIAYSIVLGCQQALITFFVLRKKDHTLRRAGGPIAIMLAALAFTNLVRVLGVFHAGAPADYLQAGPFLSWIVMINSCLQCGAMVSYVWMTAALLRNDLEVQASTDPLTGLLNRRAIERAADHQITACSQSAAPICAILVDLDRFKSINDTFGHHCGDSVLVSVASALKTCIRQSDLLARMGGDEFAVLLPFTSIEAATKRAEDLRSVIENLNWTDGNSGIRVTASFGLAQMDPAVPSWDNLVFQCDKALYAAKHAGRNAASIDQNHLESSFAG